MATRKSRAEAVQPRNQERRPDEVHRYDGGNYRFVLEYLPLLHSIARTVWTRFGEGVTIDDLVSAGTIGLVQAMGKYDDKRGIKLSTFAYSRIRGAMIDELRALDWFPKSMRDRAKKLERADQRLSVRLGRQPTDQEMAEELGMNRSDYLNRARDIANLSMVSIDEMWEMGDSSPEGPRGEGTDQSRPSAEDYAEEREERAAVARQVSSLPERQRHVLQRYFYDDMTLKEIAAEIGVTEARVSQIRQKSIAGLRASFSKG